MITFFGTTVFFFRATFLGVAVFFLRAAFFFAAGFFRFGETDRLTIVFLPGDLLLPPAATAAIMMSRSENEDTSFCASDGILLFWKWMI